MFTLFERDRIRTLSVNPKSRERGAKNVKNLTPLDDADTGAQIA
jgi:hypothetical protein